MSLAINTHVLTGKKHVLIKQFRAVDARLLYFTYTHSRLSQKLTSSTVMCIEMNVIKWRYNDVSLLWNSSSCFNAPISNAKMNFSKRFFQSFQAKKMTLCNNNDQTWFSDTPTSATCVYTSGVIKTQWKLSPFRLGFQHHPRDPADVYA